MKEVVRYSEAFKQRLVEDIAGGKYTSIEEARRRNGIRGLSTVSKWVKRYGREDIPPKRIKVETMNEIDELQAARSRKRPWPMRTWNTALRARFWTLRAGSWGRARRS